MGNRDPISQKVDFYVFIQRSKRFIFKMKRLLLFLYFIKSLSTPAFRAYGLLPFFYVPQRHSLMEKLQK